MPHRGHAAHNGGAHQDQHHRALLGCKLAHHAFVACKQAGHAARGGGVHRKQIAWHVNHAQQFASNGHVNAVVVARA